jgi:hypothetical protein
MGPIRGAISSTKYAARSPALQCYTIVMTQENTSLKVKIGGSLEQSSLPRVLCNFSRCPILPGASFIARLTFPNLSPLLYNMYIYVPLLLSGYSFFTQFFIILTAFLNKQIWSYYIIIFFETRNAFLEHYHPTCCHCQLRRCHGNP